MKALFVTAALLLAPTRVETPRESAPHDGLVTIVKSLRANDIVGAMRASVSESRFAALKAGWDENRSGKPDPAENAQFQAVMAMLTAPGAEDALMAQVEPKLREARPQIGMVAGMIAGMGQMAVQENTTLSPEERAQVQRLLEAFGKHLVSHDVTDPASARTAIGILCSTARELRLASLEDVQKLSFEELLGKIGVVFGGVKSMLDVYGISVDRSLDSFQAETVTATADHAVVRVRFEFLGVENSSDVELVRSGSDWWPKE